MRVSSSRVPCGVSLPVRFVPSLMCILTDRPTNGKPIRANIAAKRRAGALSKIRPRKRKKGTIHLWIVPLNILRLEKKLRRKNDQLNRSRLASSPSR